MWHLWHSVTFPVTFPSRCWSGYCLANKWSRVTCFILLDSACCNNPRKRRRSRDKSIAPSMSPIFARQIPSSFWQSYMTSTVLTSGPHSSSSGSDSTSTISPRLTVRAPSCRVQKWATMASCDMSLCLSMNAKTVSQSWRVKFLRLVFADGFAEVAGLSLPDFFGHSLRL